MVEIEYQKDDFVLERLPFAHFVKQKLCLIIIADAEDVLRLNAIFFKDGWGFVQMSSGLSKRVLKSCVEDE
jgi:hypothetical protein